MSIVMPAAEECFSPLRWSSGVLYLIDQGGFSAAELGGILNGSSGLRAVSGQSGDMQALLESEMDDAALACRVSCHAIVDRWRTEWHRSGQPVS